MVACRGGAPFLRKARHWRLVRRQSPDEGGENWCRQFTRRFLLIDSTVNREDTPLVGLVPFVVNAAQRLPAWPATQWEGGGDGRGGVVVSGRLCWGGVDNASGGGGVDKWSEAG